LLFNEPVDTTTFTVGDFSLGSDDHSGGVVTLSDSTTTSVDGLTVVINIGMMDWQHLLMNPSVCSVRSTCFIYMTSGFIKDMSGNPSNALTSGFVTWRVPTAFTADTTAPMLSKFDLNLNLNQITLYFSKPVSKASVMTTDLILQSASSVSLASQMYQFVGSSSSLSVNGKTIIMQLSSTELTNIKMLGFAKSSTNTFISTQSGLAQDLTPQANAVSSIAITSGIAVQTFTPPSHVPNLVSFTFIQTSIILTFDDVMTTVGTNIGSITLQNTNLVLV